MIAAAINCIVWLYGIEVLHWNLMEVQVLFLLDMGLFILFGALRILISLDGDKNFFIDLPGRIYFAALMLVPSALIIYFVSPISDEPAPVINYFFTSSNKWMYALMLLNYTGYFIHDYLYSGFFKVSNPFVEGVADFITIMLTGVMVSLVIAFLSPEKDTAEFDMSYGIALVIARFGCEIILYIQCRTFLNNSKE